MPIGRMEAGMLLDELLDGSARRLQGKQRSSLLDNFEKNGTPLWLRLAYEQARHWHSSSEPIAFPEETHGLIQETVVENLLDLSLIHI